MQLVNDFVIVIVLFIGICAFHLRASGERLLVLASLLLFVAVSYLTYLGFCNYKQVEEGELMYRVELKDGRFVNGQNCRRESGNNICQIPESEFFGNESSKMLDISVESFSKKEVTVCD